MNRMTGLLLVSGLLATIPPALAIDTTPAEESVKKATKTGVHAVTNAYQKTAIVVSDTVAGRPSVHIISPHANGTVKSPLKVQWKFVPGGKAHHVHMWVDGKGPNPMPGKTSSVLKLAPGVHSVKIIAATRQHKEIGPEDKLSFKVQ